MDDFDLSGVPIEEIYQAIGNFIVRSIDDDWETATIYAEIESDDNGLTYGRYTTKESTDESLFFRAGASMYFAFDELRKRMRKPGTAPWTKARFVLQRDGKFDLQFEYPDQGQSGSAA